MTSRTSTPANPIPRPIPRSRVGRSSGSTAIATNTVRSGVVAFHIPATTDVTCLSIREEGKGKGVDEQRRHAQMTPYVRIPGKRFPADRKYE
jgi:hypothetical protein